MIHLFITIKTKQPSRPLKSFWWYFLFGFVWYSSMDPYVIGKHKCYDAPYYWLIKWSKSIPKYNQYRVTIDQDFFNSFGVSLFEGVCFACVRTYVLLQKKQQMKQPNHHKTSSKVWETNCSVTYAPVQCFIQITNYVRNC